jgi:hypothetical protein
LECGRGYRKLEVWKEVIDFYDLIKNNCDWKNDYTIRDTGEFYVPD